MYLAIRYQHLLKQLAQIDISLQDLTSIRSGYSSSVVTDENVSDREKQEDSSSDESDDSFLDSNGSVCIDDVIRCRCGDLEEQGFMIQVSFCIECASDCLFRSSPFNILRVPTLPKILKYPRKRELSLQNTKNP